MKTRIDINNEAWCNIVFEGKNKAYGAFTLRTHESQQKVRSLLITIILAISVAVMPLIKKKVNPLPSDKDSGIPITLTPITIDPPKPIRIDPPQDTKPSRPIIKFAAPIVADNDPSDNPIVNDDLFKRNVMIGLQNIKGDEKSEYVPIIEKAAIGEPKEKVYDFVEKPPQFIGGMDELMNFLRKNLRFPDDARSNGISGRVIVQFIVDKNGELKNIKILRGLDDSCNQETLRVLKLMPKWSPGIQNGQPVSVYFTLPVVFSLQDR
ncbi:MAG TPA: TonB family protein [Bacteroidales bacterium]